jgi:hypothetical protein
MAHETTGADRDVVDVRDGRADATQPGQRDHPVAQAGEVYEQRVVTKSAKTSAAATFSLVFGTSAVLTLLMLVEIYVATLLGLIAITLGVVGLRMARRRGVTGKGVAAGGTALGLTAVVLSVMVFAGVSTFLNDESAVDRIERQLDQLRERLPDRVDLPST